MHVTAHRIEGNFLCPFPELYTAAGLFSATQSKAVEQLARAGLRNAVRVSVDLQCSGIQIHQQQHKLHNTLSQLDYVQQTPISLEIQWQQGGHIQKMQQLLLFVQVCSNLAWCCWCA